MKKKWFVMLIAVLTLTLALSGCAAAARTANAAQTTSAEETDETACVGCDETTQCEGTSARSRNAGEDAAACEDCEDCENCDGTQSGSKGNNASENCEDCEDCESCDGMQSGTRGNSANKDAATCENCGESSALSGVIDEEDRALSLAGYGSEGALNDADLSLADMLTYALQDEYLAHAEYEMILDTYGSQSPFTSIIHAEETHIDALLPLFTTYAIEAPEDEGAAHTLSVSSLTDAYQAGVDAEINNIAMYEAFLSEDLPDDVRTVFESLMSASENHLQAFRNHL